MKALYRKYRPTKLEDVIGQPQVTDGLIRSLKQQAPNHAYLFIGPRGTGKTSVARIFAHAVNGFDYQLEDSYLDIIEIDAASNTGVDNIRELREKAIIAPSVGKYKVYIIDEVHMLSKSAANALLKTLEEPPEHVIFIMATTEANKVPITISSRTALYHFRLADADTMFQHLRRIADLEKIKIDDDALRIVVRQGGGSFRDSLSLLDQVSNLTDKQITAELLNDALGLPTDQAVEQLLVGYQSGDATIIRQTLSELLSAGLSSESIAAELLSRLVQNPSPSTIGLLSVLPRVNPPFAEAKLLVALLANLKPAPAAPVVQSVPRVHTAASVAAPVSEPTPAPQPAPPRPKPAGPLPPFDWEEFIDAVWKQSDALYQQLKRCEHALEGEEVHLYPETSFVLKILKKPENGQIMSDILGGRGLIVHELGEKSAPGDALVSQISAIMGNVKEVKDDIPF